MSRRLNSETAVSHKNLVLSVFPGADLLGRGFETEGYCVVRGPDLVWGGDVRTFHPPPGAFGGVIGGPPCQDFSRARRTAPTGNGLAMLAEFARIVGEAQPDWFLMENVPGVPAFAVAGFEIQRFNLNAAECGCRQNRLRTFHFGSRDSSMLVCDRAVTFQKLERTCLASEASRPDRRGWGDFCELQGLPRDFNLPGLSVSAKYRAVGNGVPVPMARVIARAVRARQSSLSVSLCACGCGRPLAGRQTSATPGCRKRLERARKIFPR
ncbi:site-specific DNA methylase [Opitutaceae bacterium TAV1]|nr:site-specific DNA methylase [Opitutaceae bacterium TAV1]